MWKLFCTAVTGAIARASASWVGVDVAEGEVADQTLLAQGSEGLETLAEGFAVRDFHRADAQVHEVEAAQAQGLEVVLDGAAQSGGGALGRAAGAEDRAHLGGDDQAGRIRMEGLADESIGADAAVAAPVEGRRVDVVDAKLDGSAQDGAADLRIARRAMEARGGQAHGAEAEPIDAEVAAEAVFVGLGHGSSAPWPSGSWASFAIRMTDSSRGATFGTGGASVLIET